ncbi:MAG: FtsX-like permease family protein [Syntrophales bacterium LBB04]|nr:FtsX-like permease family protein [Syntrophales bacterium LBB04]
MRLHNISLNNLRRRKGKAAFLIIGLLIGVATVVTLVTLTKVMEEDMGKKLDELGANIIIVPKSHEFALNYGGMNFTGVSLGVTPLHGTDLQKIRQIKNRENLSIVAPKLIESVSVGGKDVFVAGVDFEEELRLKKWWRIMPSPKAAVAVSGHSMNEPIKGKSAFLIKDSLGGRDLIAGAEAARRLQLSEGSPLTIKGQTFQVRAILEESGSQDDLLLFLPLSHVQKIAGRGDELSLVEVAAFCNTCPIEDMVKQLSESLPGAKVTAIKQSVEARQQTVSHFKRFSIGISAVVLFIGSLIVFTTMMASVNERTREIGIFRAIGFRKRHIIQVILLEAFLIGLVAGLAGYAVGAEISRMTLPLFLQSQGIRVPWDVTPVLLATAISVLLALAASIYPALRAARLDPAEALRAM